MTRIADPITAMSRPMTVTAGPAAGNPLAALFSGTAEAPATGLFALLLQEAAPMAPSLPAETALPQPITPPDIATMPAEAGEFVAGVMLPQMPPQTANMAQPGTPSALRPPPIPAEISVSAHPRAAKAPSAPAALPMPQLVDKVAAEMAPATAEPDPEAVAAPAAAAAVAAPAPQPGSAQIAKNVADHAKPGAAPQPDAEESETITPEVSVTGSDVPPRAVPPGAEAQNPPQPGGTQPEGRERKAATPAPRPETDIVVSDLATGLIASPHPAATAVAAPPARSRFAKAPDLVTTDISRPALQSATAPAPADIPVIAPAVAPATPAAAPTPVMAKAAEPQPLTAGQFAAAPLQARILQPASSLSDRPTAISAQVRLSPPTTPLPVEDRSATMNLDAAPDSLPQPAQPAAEENPIAARTPTKALKIDIETPKALSPAPVSPAPVPVTPASAALVSQAPVLASANSPGTVARGASATPVNPAGSAMAASPATGIIAETAPQPPDAARDLGKTAPAATQPPRAGAEPTTPAERPEAPGEAPLPEARPPAAAPAQPVLAPEAAQGLSAAAPLPSQPSAAPPSDLAQPLAPLETERPEWQADLVSRITARIEEQGAIFDIALTPETLGSVEVRLELRDGKADVTFVTETREAARLLAQSEAKLGELLARSGVSLNSQDASARDQSQSQQRPDRLPMSRAGKQDEAPAAPQTPTRRSGLNLIA